MRLIDNTIDDMGDLGVANTPPSDAIVSDDPGGDHR